MAIVVGAFRSQDAANRAVDDLMAGGFQADQVTVHTKDGKVPDISSTGRTTAMTDQDQGGGAGGTQTGGVAPMGLGAVAAAGAGPTLGAGGGSEGLGANAAGGYGGGLVSYFLANGANDEDANHYAGRAGSGSYLVSVRADTAKAMMAEVILQTAGAETPIHHQ